MPEVMLPTFRQMHVSAVRVAHEATAVLKSHDLETAETIQRDDDLLDRLHGETFTATLDDDSSFIPRERVDVTLCARYLERFGDHGVAIARRVVYLVTGDFPGDPTVNT